MSNFKRPRGIHLSWLVLGCLAIFLAACNRDEQAHSTTAADAASGQPTDAIIQPIATPTVDWASAAAQTPAGMVDVLYAGVETGKWSYEDGLLSMLAILAGDGEMGSVAAIPPTSLEGTGLIFEAQHFLAAGGDPQTALEIEQLLFKIAPAPDRLLEYARPALTEAVKAPGHAQAALAEQNCSALWAEGFPAGTGVKCFEYKEITVGNSKVELFYPITPLAPGFTLGYADAALEAVKAALQTYSKLSVAGNTATLKDVQIIFTLLEDPKPAVLAMVPSTGGAKVCQIIVYPLSITNNEGEKAQGASAFGHFQQTLAHETFHCLQVWNLPKISDAPWGVQDWWGEGTAAYFGNTVYPAVNQEWEYLGYWKVRSLNKPLVELSYENFGFFQYLGNTLGDNAILTMLTTLPAQGDENAQADALSAYPNFNIQQLFHSYAQAFVDGKIADSSGALLDTSPPYLEAKHQFTVSKADVLNLAAAPFVLRRYAVTFEPGHRYVLSFNTTGSEGLRSAKPQGVAAGWGELPSQVMPACQPITYFVVVTTSVSPSGEGYKTEVNITPQEELTCDECLIGIWYLDVPTYVDNLMSLMPSTESDQVNVDFAGGVWRLEFTKQAVFTGTYNFVTLYNFYQVNAPFGNDIQTDLKLTMDGDISTLYFTDGVGHMQMSLLQDNLDFGQQIIMNGEEIPVDENAFAELFTPSASSSITYSCDEDTLYLNFAPESALLPFKFNRNN